MEYGGLFLTLKNTLVVVDDQRVKPATGMVDTANLAITSTGNIVTIVIVDNEESN